MNGANGTSVAANTGWRDGGICREMKCSAELKEADVSYSRDCVKCCTPSSSSSHSFCKSLNLIARSKHPDPSDYIGETGEV